MVPSFICVTHWHLGEPQMRGHKKTGGPSEELAHVLGFSPTQEGCGCGVPRVTQVLSSAVAPNGPPCSPGSRCSPLPSAPLTRRMDLQRYPSHISLFAQKIFNGFLCPDKYI